MKLCAAIFDMDGVLLDNNQWHVRAWIEFAARYGHAMTKEQVESSFGNTNRDYLFKLFGRQLDEDKIRQLADEKEEIYRQSIRNNLQALPGLVSFLETLEDHDFAIGLVTGGPISNVDFILSGLGISRYFREIVHDALVSEGKPDPEGYLLASRLLGVKPASCIVFEDSANGVLAAKTAGMKVVGIDTAHNPGKLSHANFICKDFRDIQIDDIFQLLNSGI